MTGAGFGGCAIALVKKNNFDDFARKLRGFYCNETGYEPDVLVSNIGAGVKEI